MSKGGVCARKVSWGRGAARARQESPGRSEREGLCQPEYLGRRLPAVEKPECLGKECVMPSGLQRGCVTFYSTSKVWALPLPCLLAARGSVSLYFGRSDGCVLAGCDTYFPGDCSR